MKAVRIHAFGGTEVLKYEDAPLPEIGPNEVLIKVCAAGVNPVDWRIRSGQLGMHVASFPKILGSDVSGIVEEVGSLVRRFRPGDAVIARTESTYAHYVAAKSDVAAHAPRTIALKHAAGIPVAGCVAWSVLFDVAQLRPGQSVLVHAGSGGVGTFAVQLAKLVGARVISTTSAANNALVKSLGADEVIDYKSTDFSTELSDVDVVFDTIGGETQTRSWRVLRNGGVLASILSKPDEELAKRHHARGFFTRREVNGAMLEELVNLIDARKLRVVIDREFALADAHLAHELSASGRARGKIILTVFEPPAEAHPQERRD